MKYLLVVLPCVIAVVLVRAQLPGATVGTAGAGGFGGAGAFGAGLGAGGFGAGGLGGGRGNLPVVYYPYPSPSRGIGGSLGPILQEIEAENSRAFAANLCKYNNKICDHL